MQVQVLSDTIQTFGGVRFYSCGKYFQHAGKRLHKAVWEYHNGAIPKGFHVHHIDGNRSNNQIENLALLSAHNHLSMHSLARGEYNQQHMEDIRPLANEWHGSDAGKEFHSKLAKETWKKKQENAYVCSECGKEFKTRHDYGKEQLTFCSNACKTRHRAKSGVDDEERVCAYCGKPFMANKYSKKSCCSRACAVKHRWGK